MTKWKGKTPGQILEDMETTTKHMQERMKAQKLPPDLLLTHSEFGWIVYITDDLPPIKNPIPIKLVKLRYVYRALKGQGWMQRKTARKLGLSDRGLRYYVTRLRKMGIKIPSYK